MPEVPKRIPGAQSDFERRGHLDVQLGGRPECQSPSRGWVADGLDVFCLARIPRNNSEASAAIARNEVPDGINDLGHTLRLPSAPRSNETQAEQSAKGEQAKHTRFGNWLVRKLNGVKIEIDVAGMGSLREGGKSQIRCLSSPRMDIGAIKSTVRIGADRQECERLATEGHCEGARIWNVGVSVE